MAKGISKHKMTVSTLVAKLEAASFAYHNGQPELMTDAEYDATVDALREANPDHPFLKKVGAPVTTGDEVALPIPLPSLNKIKDTDAISKWQAKNPATAYHVSVKLDGCSALWIPATKKLYTRGDGMRGRDISHFAPYFQGFPSAASDPVRGELIMRTDSIAVPEGKLARNIVAGALNRKVPDPELFANIQFIAYELISSVDPVTAFATMKAAGYKTATSVTVTPTQVEPTYLSRLFTALEAKSLYQLDGIVLAPVAPRITSAVATVVREGEAVNPTDKVAWKTRTTAATARTTVREVEWNVSHLGYLIPRVLFDPVQLAGATIRAATGLHGRWIFENGVGPGAVIEVRRAGDVIPQIIAVETHVTPAMPSEFKWESEGGVHILPAGVADVAAAACAQLTHALADLGAENVGPGIVAKLYAAGFTTVGALYKASAAEFAAKVGGCKDKGAERIWAGLRVKQSTWTTLTFMTASCTMPRGVGTSKLTPLLELEANPALWTAATLKAARPAGLSDKTIDAIVEAIPAYLAWVTATGLTATTATVVKSKKITTTAPMTIVFTGVRDKSLEATLAAAGHTVADTVSKKTTHVVYADGPRPATTKITKGEELGAKILSVSEFREQMSV